jgi:ketosteroid isomerase-like protein
MSEDGKMRTLKAVLDGFNNHDPDAIVENCVEDCVFEAPRGADFRGRRFKGRAAVRKGFADRFAGIPDVHYGHDSHFISGDRAVSEWTLTGTGLAGEPIKVRGCDLWTFQGDKIARKDSYWKIVEVAP